MISRILIDLDGVLADFHGSSLKLLGSSLTVHDLNGETWLPDKLGITEDEFWRRIDVDAERFWTGMPLLDDAHAIIEAATAAVGIDNIGICSSPSRNPLCVAYKVQWVREHFPQLYRRVVITASKHFCANPKTLLIDDWEKNQHFEDHDGHFFLIPRPWNTRHAEAGQAIDVLHERLRGKGFMYE